MLFYQCLIMRVVFVVLVLLRVQDVHSASKGVVASLQAKWSMTPLLLETRWAGVFIILP